MVRCEIAQRRARSHSRRRCGSLGASESPSDDNFHRCDEEGRIFGGEGPQSATRCRSRKSATGVRRRRSGSTSAWANRGAGTWGRRAAGSADTAGAGEALVADSSSSILSPPHREVSDRSAIGEGWQGKKDAAPQRDPLGIGCAVLRSMPQDLTLQAEGFARLYLIPMGWKVLGGVAIWLVGHYAIRFFRTALRRTMRMRRIDVTLSRYLDTGATVVLQLLVLIAVLGVLGVETTSFAALLAAAGIAIGAAWSGLLSNFAAGLFLLRSGRSRLAILSRRRGLPVPCARLVSSSRQSILPLRSDVCRQQQVVLGQRSELQRQRVSPRRPDRAAAIGRRHRPDHRQDSTHARRHSARADRPRARRRNHDDHSRRVHAGGPAFLSQRSLLAGVLRHQQGDRAGTASGAGCRERTDAQMILGPLLRRRRGADDGVAGDQPPSIQADERLEVAPARGVTLRRHAAGDVICPLGHIDVLARARRLTRSDADSGATGTGRPMPPAGPAGWRRARPQPCRQRQSEWTRSRAGWPAPSHPLWPTPGRRRLRAVSVPRRSAPARARRWLPGGRGRALHRRCRRFSILRSAS